MADEEEKLDQNEEVEYQFTDDQINYQMEDEEETQKAEPSSAMKEEGVGFSRYRRLIIAVVAFFVLIFVVYKILGPTNLPPTEFAQNVKPGSTLQPNQPKPLVPNVGTASPLVQKKEEAPPPNMAPPTGFAPSQASTTETQSVPFTPTPPSEQTTAEVNPSSTVAPPAEAPISSGPISTSVLPNEQPAPPTPSTTEVDKVVVEKIASLEDQASKLQAQYMQKMADYETQNNALQEKVTALNSRLSNIEASITKMAQLMESNKTVAVTTTEVVKPIPPPPPPRVILPKVIYVVQAIIPGRAWLKSDTGDTITVAEGDSIKGYGKVTKIDPYDGIVEIDTGSKIMTLSYGLTGD